MALRLRLGDIDCVGEPVEEVLPEGHWLPLMLPLRVSVREELLELEAKPVGVRAEVGLRVSERELVSVTLAVLQALCVTDTLRDRVTEAVWVGVGHAVEEREGVRVALEQPEALWLVVREERREAVASEEAVRDRLGEALAEALPLQEGGAITPAGQ